MIRLILLVFMAGSMVAPDSAVAENTDVGHCQKASDAAYRNIPRLFYSNQPDSLFGVVMAWQDACGELEPVLRLKILAAIWDDAFTENLYDSNIIDHLIQRYDPKGQDGIPGEIINLADFSFHAARFDTFTTSLADQLLPHTSAGTVEYFFCLFYSGQTEAAFEMLHGTDLAGTDLRWYYQREMTYLRREEPLLVVAVTSGVWSPEGDLLRVGDHALVGMTLGRRKGRWLGRFAVEFRPGRSAYPYFVDQEEVSGWSDRYDGFYVGLEVGRELMNHGPHRIDFFLGLGYDGIKPFWEEDLVLGTVNANLGAGYRFFLGSGSGWVAGVDYRAEFLGVRNAGGTPLSGEASSLRISLGYSPGGEKSKRLSGLGH